MRSQKVWNLCWPMPVSIAKRTRTDTSAQLGDLEIFVKDWLRFSDIEGYSLDTAR